jgi:hypothetical protein
MDGYLWLNENTKKIQNIAIGFVGAIAEKKK